MYSLILSDTGRTIRNERSSKSINFTDELKTLSENFWEVELSCREVGNSVVSHRERL
jgi:hypothetical protein